MKSGRGFGTSGGGTLPQSGKLLSLSCTNDCAYRSGSMLLPGTGKESRKSWVPCVSAPALAFQPRKKRWPAGTVSGTLNRRTKVKSDLVLVASRYPPLAVGSVVSSGGVPLQELVK